MTRKTEIYLISLLSIALLSSFSYAGNPLYWQTKSKLEVHQQTLCEELIGKYTASMVLTGDTKIYELNRDKYRAKLKSKLEGNSWFKQWTVLEAWDEAITRCEKQFM